MNTKQSIIYEKIVNGDSVLLTGPAGTGKTYVIKKFYYKYKDEKKIGLTSMTGTSAVVLGGRTVHSFLGIGLGTGSAENLYKRLMQGSAFIKNVWKNLEVLIIDEVSMLNPELFDKLEYVARRIRRNDKPFGGIQLILSGDFCQLPCITKNEDNVFCFEAETWSNCIKYTFILEDIVRQSEVELQKCLNEARFGKLSSESLELLKNREDATLEQESKGIIPTRLYAVNKAVDLINQREFEKIPGELIYEYEMTVEGIDDEDDKEKYIKSCIAPRLLQLCIGAQVMLLKNLGVSVGLCNGSRGRVIGFTEEGEPKVVFCNGMEVVVSEDVWEYDLDTRIKKKQAGNKEGENKEDKVFVKQIPLKLAYAISIHKSQGMTLDCVEVDLKDVFTCGQAYTALSRVKTLDGLRIKNFDVNYIQVHPKVVSFYNENIEMY